MSLMLADVLLVPVQPRGLDIWAVGQMASLVEAATATPDGLRALVVLNLADPGASPDNADAAAALADFPALTLVEGPIRRRKAFAAAAARGLSVDELMPIDIKAIHYLSDVATLVFNH